MKKNKALFLDRDGTINFDSGYVYDPESLILLEGVSDSIAKAKDAGFLIIIITNQSCVGRGYCTINEVIKTNQKLEALLLRENNSAHIDDTLIATDHPDKPTSRRKPQAGMILEAQKKFDLDLSQCWVIGDKISDPQTGLNAGIPENNCLQVMPNRSLDENTENKNDEKFRLLKGLTEAVNLILSQPTKDD